MQAIMLGGCCWLCVGCVCRNDESSVGQSYLCQINKTKICARKIRDDAFSFALLIVHRFENKRNSRNHDRSLTACHTNSPKMSAKRFRDSVSKSAKKIHFPGNFIGRCDSRRIRRAMTGEIGGSGIPNRAGICVDQSFSFFHSWRRCLRFFENLL